ncbi:MAG: hypothetical protein OEQ74_00005, partial [Gammaproteobacteria bacterium]|nr:hypothetical protein [Gammaproteobacteria bacterium]
EQILNHHALYRDFIRQANEHEKQYRVIIGLRNPLDSVISSYFKYRTGHHEIYQKPFLRKVGRLRGHVRYFNDNRKYRWVKKHDASCEEYFLHFYHLPYADWSMLDKDKYDHFIRFENIQEDFANTLEGLGIEQVRPLPVRNKTEVKGGRDPVELFTSTQAIRRAKRVFGPFMKLWDYEFPVAWGSDESTYGKLLFPPVSGIYTFYWKYLR